MLTNGLSGSISISPFMLGTAREHHFRIRHLPRSPSHFPARTHSAYPSLSVTRALGLEPIGWIFTRPPRRADPGEPPLRPAELFAVAQQQLAHPSGAAGVYRGVPTSALPSRFVSLVVARTPAGTIEPQGFQASEQLAALVRDGVLAPPAAGDALFRIRAPAGGEPPLPEVIRKDALRGRYKSAEFEPEFVTVTLEAGRGHESAAKEAADGGPFFRHAAFPVENRGDLGAPAQTPAAMRAHLAAHRSEPYAQRLSDFHALLYLARLLDVDTAVAVATAVAAERPLGEGLELILRSIEAAR